MHIEAKTFIESVKKTYPDFFVNKRVIDIGAGDINGNNRYLFDNCEFIGVDVVSAPNVDLVSMAKDIPESIGLFDVVISSECFEHDMQVYYSLRRIMKLLKPGGLFVFTCASEGRPEHGTKRTSASDSYSLQLTTDLWYPNYYRNITMDDFVEILNPHHYFMSVSMTYNPIVGDFYFYGFRKNSEVLEDPVNSLSNVMNCYPTDKNSYFHNYPRQYNNLLKEYRLKNIRFLEIGVFQGHSIRAWRDYFRNATHIVGIDIDSRCAQYTQKDDAIYVHIGDINSQKVVEEVNNLYGPFDIIIDDGSHINVDVQNTFELLFPKLNNNGLYIVEDTITYKSSAHQNTDKINQLQYFQNLTKYLNQWRYDANIPNAIQDHCVDPFKIEKKTDNPLEYGIDSIHFGCSFIAVKKVLRKHWI